jgi:hypothetical protein
MIMDQNDMLPKNRKQRMEKGKIKSQKYTKYCQAKDFRFSQQYYTKPTTAIRCHRNYLFYVCVERSTAKKMKQSGNNSKLFNAENQRKTRDIEKKKLFVFFFSICSRFILFTVVQVLVPYISIRMNSLFEKAKLFFFI